MAEEKENRKQKAECHKGTTKHCCYGLCNSDSRYLDRPYMENVKWIPFPKPKRLLEKCQRWLRACGRDDFTVGSVRKWTYICSKHFIGGNGQLNNIQILYLPVSLHNRYHIYRTLQILNFYYMMYFNYSEHVKPYPSLSE